MEPDGSFSSSKSLSLDDDTSWQNRVDFMCWFFKKHFSLPTNPPTCYFLFAVWNLLYVFTVPMDAT